MDRKNDSSQVAGCFNWLGSSRRDDDPEQMDVDQQKSETACDPQRPLIDFSEPSANPDEATSFEHPSPSAERHRGVGASSSCGGAGPGAEDVPSGSTERSLRDERPGASTWTPTHEPRQWRTKRAQDCDVVMGSLSYSLNHTVLVNVNEFNHHKKLVAADGRTQWDAVHVKMPYSKENIFMKTGFWGDTDKMPRWTVISKQLKKLQKGSPTVPDVEKAIKSYNPQYENSWSFAGLQLYAQSMREQESIFSQVIPKMAELALRLPETVLKAIPLLQQGRTHAITLSQYQIACLLANAFFCTFPHRNTTARNAEYGNYPTINFSSLFGNTSHTVKEKLRAILNYFKTITEEASRPSGLVTFQRCHFRDSEFPQWRNQKEVLGNVRFTSEGTIEKEGKGLLQVDFACSLIGGGVLGSGLVQEEILFLMNPELIVARLFTAKLTDNECLKITGPQQYSEYAGYSKDFEWRGMHQEVLPRDGWKRLHRQIVAIDALNFKYPKEQYHKNKIKRELNKAFIGFSEKSVSPSDLPTIATGNWGCGAFHGDPILKALIQMMAAAVAQRDLLFFTFGDKRLERELWKIYTLLTERKTTVGDIYTLLDIYCKQIEAGAEVELSQYIWNQMKSSL